mgnify:CR=1 FL=1
MGLLKDPSNMAGGWPPIAIMRGARHNQSGENLCWLSWQAPVEKPKQLNP